MHLQELTRKLEVLSVTPAFLKGLIDKQIYLKSATNRERVAALPATFFQTTAPIVDGRRVTPAGYYTGIWCRDASYILDEFYEMGNMGDTVRWLEWIWQKQVRPGEPVWFGRGSPKTRFRFGPADEKYLKEHDGALPTSIQHGYSEIYGAEPDIDSTALITSVTCKVCLTSESLMESFLPRIRKAIQSLEKRDIDGDGLLEQGPNEDWMDSMLRSGKIVYSQAAWVKALLHWSELLQKAGRSQESEECLEKARKVTSNVNSKLWNEHKACYCDLSDKSETDRLSERDVDYQEMIGSNGNGQSHITQDISLFLLFEEPDSARAIASLNTLASELWTEVGPRCTSPPSKVTAPFRLREHRYQNGGFWPWITSLEILARLRHHQKDKSSALLMKTLPLSALEWVNPYCISNSGSYPFRTSIAAIRLALRAFNNS